MLIDGAWWLHSLALIRSSRFTVKPSIKIEYKFTLLDAPKPILLLSVGTLSVINKYFFGEKKNNLKL